ncbi:phytanoyl-CoA dioxygenase family protein [Archangium primigenium]|uniref:phytanoyl-CoA dioxygenase family protein n=1 Tax=[Archangium] primigenium TaxID=2792470 RepID=UPI0019561305|nr:phytanoyl-CoA dioxygenase family protein [Archangium primigenium]MBM7116650.1 phytanoyl-CoA dioxygenase family protein [Archangium primigenium]
MNSSSQRRIEMHLQHGESLVARSAGGAWAECEPHHDLPHVYTVDTGTLAPGEPFRYVVRRADGTERAERFFAHSLERGGPMDVWEGIRAIDNAFYATEVREHLERRGFAVVRRVLSEDLLSTLRAVVQPLITDVWEANRAAHRDKINLEKVLLHVPHLLQALAEKVGPLLKSILGNEVFLEYEQVMVVRAGTAYATKCHRDVDGGKAGYSEASRRHKGSVHLWIPLVDIDATRACMYVDPFDAPGQSLDMTMRAGDALFLHNYVWHGSRANTSGVDRISWLLNFAPAPSHDESNPGADLNLQLLRGGVPTDLAPDVCNRLAQEKHRFLNLFDAFFTYDPSQLRMVHPDNRRGNHEARPLVAGTPRKPVQAQR